jgi:hypothetical protein
MDVILHVGAHRTGTTTLQQTLRRNTARLTANKVAHWGPRATRSPLFEGLVKSADRVTDEVAAQGRIAVERIGTQMAQLRGAGMRSLIVSEENMLGAVPACVIARRLYPDAARRMARFRPAFADSCTRIGVSIRSYDQLWASMLGFTVKRTGRVPDKALLADLVAQPRRWRDVIRELHVVFPKAEIVVWPFEGMVDTPQLLIPALTGRTLPVPLEPVDMIHNPSPDLETLRAVVAEGPCAQHLTRLPAGSTLPWRPFSEAQVAQMRADYATDIDWLRADPGCAVTYIESPEDIAGLTGQERGVLHDEGQRRVG